MNAVEIEEAVSDLARAPFDPATFPFEFLTAFGVKETTIARLRKGDTNASDVGGVLQRSNIHIAVAAPGDVNGTLRILRESPKTAAAKAKFILASDGDVFEAEDLTSGEALACSYHDFADHFGFFLPLAGISTVKEIKNNPIDVKATGRLNRLYVELLKENADWGTPERRHDLNQFMARLIFCFFAEDTGIFNGTNLFTSTIERMSNNERGSVEFVITELFRAMDTSPEERATANLRTWADDFPYVNGGLFAGGKPCPNFSKVARSYLLRAGELNWQEINPDIFGSMIQAVADEGERGSLGMHYTSVPNIMKVLAPLFLDNLRDQLESAGNNVRKLRNLRKRLAKIRVFDPACGSGNFLVIAYIRMREIEHEIIRQTDDDPKSVIPLANFYGIEIKDFAAEIARLALLIAEFQCDVRFINQHVARSLVLPLKRTGQITTGNALTEDWLGICPNEKSASDLTCKAIKINTGTQDHDDTPECIGFETYICGNPPYLGSKKKSADQVNDMVAVGLDQAKLLDYVAAFIVKAKRYAESVKCEIALVSTSSICQGEQVSLLWPKVLDVLTIRFAYRPFKWSNNAANNAGVYVTIVGLSKQFDTPKFLYDDLSRKLCKSISPYLIEGDNVIIKARPDTLSKLPRMEMGSNPVDGKRLIFERDEYENIVHNEPSAERFFKRYGGTEEIISGSHRYCLWIEDKDLDAAMSIKAIKRAIDACRAYRITAGQDARRVAKKPHRFSRSTFQERSALHVGNTIGNSYAYIPAVLRTSGFVSSHAAFTIYDPDKWVIALILSQLHKTWAEAIAGRLGNGVRYATTVVYNTFPVPELTDTDKSNLSRAAENIMLIREAHFPKSIAELYDAETMPNELREAHEKNDEITERIYVGRLFRNDTERLEKLFELYVKMIAADNNLVNSRRSTDRRGRTAAKAT